MGVPTAGPTLSELIHDHDNGLLRRGHDFGESRDQRFYRNGYQDGYKAGRREKRPPITVTEAFQKGLAYGYSKAKGEHNKTLRRVVLHMTKMLWALRGELKRGKIGRKRRVE